MKAILVLFALALFATAAAKPQGVNVVENSSPDQVKVVEYNLDQANIDSAFYRPSNPQYEPVSIGPEYVQYPGGRPNGPGKQFNDPRLRGGK